VIGFWAALDELYLSRKTPPGTVEDGEDFYDIWQNTIVHEVWRCGDRKHAKVRFPGLAAHEREFAQPQDSGLDLLSDTNRGIGLSSAINARISSRSRIARGSHSIRIRVGELPAAGPTNQART
jgi:hypothetical protein